jgi:2-dehydro-3-deoxyglucarate aldolase/4-hydroxy-2-oxoheptanedioate aldolase
MDREVSSLKPRLRDGEQLIGTLVSLPSPDVAEILSLVGFDYLWIDCEHAATDFVCAQIMIQAVGGRCPCLVRIPENREVWFKKALDTGCDGVVVPQVRSADEARAAVGWSLYPPAGRRSVGISRAHRFGMAFQEYIDTINDRLTIVLQIEHIEAVRNIGSIVEVPGIDVVFIGPYDLSGSLGIAGQVSHPEVREAMHAINRTCRAAGVPLGVFAIDVEAAQDALADGYSLVAMGMDALFLSRAARAALAQVRARVSGPEGI